MCERFKFFFLFISLQNDACPLYYNIYVKMYKLCCVHSVYKITSWLTGMLRKIINLMKVHIIICSLALGLIFCYICYCWLNDVNFLCNWLFNTFYDKQVHNTYRIFSCLLITYIMPITWVHIIKIMFHLYVGCY